MCAVLWTGTTSSPGESGGVSSLPASVGQISRRACTYCTSEQKNPRRHCVRRQLPSGRTGSRRLEVRNPQASSVSGGFGLPSFVSQCYCGFVGTWAEREAYLTTLKPTKCMAIPLHIPKDAKRPSTILSPCAPPGQGGAGCGPDDGTACWCKCCCHHRTGDGSLGHLLFVWFAQLRACFEEWGSRSTDSNNRTVASSTLSL